MSSWIVIIALGALCAFVMLFPLWQRRSDRVLGAGIESDDIAVQWTLEKDRLVREQHELDIALAEGKISPDTHQIEREQVVEDAKRALDKLRQARSMNEKLAVNAEHKPRAYQRFSLVFGALIFISTIALTVHLKGLDVRKKVQTAEGAPEVQMADIKKMVASLETRVNEGQGTIKDQLMLARSYIVLGDHDKAVGLYQKIHQSDASNMGAVMALGQIYFNSKNVSEQKQSLTYFDKALVIEPNKIEALWFKSLWLVRDRKLEQARELLVRLQSVSKDNKQAQDAVGRLLAELDKNRVTNHKSKTQSPDARTN